MCVFSALWLLMPCAKAPGHHYPVLTKQVNSTLTDSAQVKVNQFEAKSCKSLEIFVWIVKNFVHHCVAQLFQLL